MIQYPIYCRISKTNGSIGGTDDFIGEMNDCVGEINDFIGVETHGRASLQLEMTVRFHDISTTVRFHDMTTIPTNNNPLKRNNDKFFQL